MEKLERRNYPHSLSEAEFTLATEDSLFKENTLNAARAIMVNGVKPADAATQYKIQYPNLAVTCRKIYDRAVERTGTKVVTFRIPAELENQITLLVQKYIESKTAEQTDLSSK